MTINTTTVVQSDQYPDIVCKIVVSEEGEYIVQGFYSGYRVAAWGPYEDSSQAMDECFSLTHKAFIQNFLLVLRDNIAQKTGLWIEPTLEKIGFSLNLHAQQSHLLNQLLKSLLNGSCIRKELLEISSVKFVDHTSPTTQVFMELKAMSSDDDEYPIQSCFLL